MAETVLELEGVSKYFPVGTGLGGRRSRVARAVDGVSFSIAAGQTLALVGESGSGKTTTARLILLLEGLTAGQIRLHGEDVSRMKGSDLRRYKRTVQAVFQDPYSSLSPRMRIKDILAEPLEIHEKLSGQALASRVGELLDTVGISTSKANFFPHQFSGGQRQRIAIARALALSPQLMILDEPVSALDVSIRAQVLNLLVDLQERLDLSYLLISHYLAIVQFMSHEVAVMYAGRIVERATEPELYTRALHPYTSALMAAVPQPDPDQALGDVVKGEVADPANLPQGCSFHPRCPIRVDGECTLEPPALELKRPGHLVACLQVHPHPSPSQKAGHS
jgi:peptide/nickel transport system ATP-binding protein